MLFEALKTVHFRVKRKIFLVERKKGLKEKEIKTEPEKYAEENYYYTYGKHIDWKNPVLFDEKLTILKAGLYSNNELVIQCADKYRVRQYVEECGLKNILNELYGVWTDYKEIDVSKIPNKFALKRNNDAGGGLIVKDKKREPQLKEKIGNR